MSFGQIRSMYMGQSKNASQAFTLNWTFIDRSWQNQIKGQEEIIITHWNWRFDTYWSIFSFGIPLPTSFFLFLFCFFWFWLWPLVQFKSLVFVFGWSFPSPWNKASFSTSILTSSRLYITLEWAWVPEKHAEYLFKVGHQLLAEVDVRVTHLLDPRMEGLEKCHFNVICWCISRKAWFWPFLKIELPKGDIFFPFFIPYLNPTLTKVHLMLIHLESTSNLTPQMISASECFSLSNPS